MTLTSIELNILDKLQTEIPLVSRPYDKIARDLGLSENVVIYKINDLLKRNIIRDISALFNGSRIGFKSTLVALQSEHPDHTARLINNHRGVSHNYLRDFDYNIWFTLTIQKEKDFDTEIKSMLDSENYRYRILPALRTYKIGVRFPLRKQKPRNPGKSSNIYQGAINVDPPLIKALQEHIPVISQPWKSLAEQLGRKEEELFCEIKQLKKAGALKRISAVLRHRNLGYKYNTMVCLKIEDSLIDEVGEKIARYPEVSHCYRRPVFSDWPFALFAMIHFQEYQSNQIFLKRLLEDIPYLDKKLLVSTKEYKKERVRYFS